jgi:hypothetical protein
LEHQDGSGRAAGFEVEHDASPRVEPTFSHEGLSAEKPGFLGVGEHDVYVIAGRGTRGDCARDLEDGGYSGTVVRGPGTSRYRVVMGDEHDVTGRRRPRDPRVNVVHARYRGRPLHRPRGRCLLHGGAQPEILQLSDQVVANLRVGRRTHRMWPLGDLLDVGEGPLRREFARRSARGQGIWGFECEERNRRERAKHERDHDPDPSMLDGSLRAAKVLGLNHDLSSTFAFSSNKPAPVVRFCCTF